LQHQVFVMQLRPMTVADLPAVLDIERISFPSPWSETMFSLELHNPASTCMVSESDGRIAGYFCAGVVLDEMDLRVIAVNPDFRRRGIGEQLVANLVEHARRQSIALVHLEVRASNAAAQHLYRKFGFRQVGVRKGYYEKPTEDALLLTLELPK
jgi:ribosomal-protein-alanine N-acetyltransferase